MDIFFICFIPVYHINHRMGKGGRPEVDLLKYQSDKAKMLETKIPYKGPEKLWGYPDAVFKEILL
jgi:hypothetical protein